MPQHQDHLVGGVLPSLRLDRDPRELHRFLGYPGSSAPGPKLASEIEEIVREGWTALKPRGVYAVWRVQHRTTNALTVGTHPLTGRVAGFLGEAERVGIFVVTIGGAISELAAQACGAGDALRGLVLDALGSWAAEASAQELIRALEAQLGPAEGLSLRYSPGYCGMRLEEQRSLFELVDGTAIGVSLTPSCMMVPEKSVSGIVGIGPRELNALRRSPCDACGQVGCHMRRGDTACP